MTILPVAEFAPDMPDLAEATSIATGVIPLTPESYGPMRSLLAYSTNALDTACLGMGASEDTSLVHHVYAGTTAKLWAMPGASATWSDKSGATYTTGAGEYWRFAQFKNLQIATNFTNAIQSVDMTTANNFANLAAAAPKCRYLAVAKNFVIAANTNDGVGGLNPARLWWPAVNDPTNWPTPGTAGAQAVMSDYNDLLGPQGQITGLAPNLAGCDCAVFFERGVFRMIFSGPPAVFDFYPAAAVKGCPAPNSIVPLGSYVYYLGEDGFYVFDGNQAVPIGANKIDRWFFNMVDQTAFALIIGAPDIANKAVCWLFRSVFATTTAPDTMLVYRWDIQRWSYGPVSAEWLSRIPVTLTAVGAGALGPVIAGQLQLAGVNTSHMLAYFNGSNQSAQVGTKVVQITPNRRTFVNATRPLVDSGAGSQFLLTEGGGVITTETGSGLLTETSTPVITVAMSARNTYQDAELFGAEQSLNIVGQAPQRSDGRYHRGRITVASGVWTTLAGLDVTGVPAGAR